MRRIIRFIRLPFSVQKIYFKALILLPICQCSVQLIPFKYLLHIFKLRPSERALLKSPTDSESAYAQTVAWVISKSPPLPQSIQPRCFAQALTARILLHQNHQECLLSIGAAMEGNGLLAHAWLRSGNIIVTGRNGQDKYREIVSYL